MEPLKVSYYLKKSDSQCVLYDLYDQLNNIKNGKHKAVIDVCREAKRNGDDKRYDQLKGYLPGITFCGTFLNTRKAELIQKYNKLIIIDIDGVEYDQISNMKTKITEDPYTHVCFMSPSGKGFKILIKLETGAEFHKAAFRALELYYLDKFQIQIDTSGSDTSRLCYVSYDPELYLNHGSKVFIYDTSVYIEELGKPSKKSLKRNPHVSVSTSKNLTATFGFNKELDRKMIRQIITFLQKKKLSITATQTEWYKCAYAIANTFSYDLGKKYFMELSMLDGDKYDEYKSERLIEYCYINRKPDGLDFSTIVHFAKKKGFITKTDKLREVDPTNIN